MCVCVYVCVRVGSRDKISKYYQTLNTTLTCHANPIVLLSTSPTMLARTLRITSLKSGEEINTYLSANILFICDNIIGII